MSIYVPLSLYSPIVYFYARLEGFISYRRVYCNFSREFFAEFGPKNKDEKR